MGCCAMVGDYYDDSSVKENLNLLLRLARVETSANSEMSMRSEVFEGLLPVLMDAGGFLSISQQRRLLERVSRVSEKRTLKSSAKT